MPALSGAPRLLVSERTRDGTPPATNGSGRIEPTPAAGVFSACFSVVKKAECRRVHVHRGWLLASSLRRHLPATNGSGRIEPTPAAGVFSA